MGKGVVSDTAGGGGDSSLWFDNGVDLAPVDSRGLNIPTGKSYKIDNDVVIDETGVYILDPSGFPATIKQVSGATVIQESAVSGIGKIVIKGGFVGINIDPPGAPFHLAGISPTILSENTTNENIDGGGESEWFHAGHKADTTLYITSIYTSSHDGAGDDSKSRIIIKTNDGTTFDPQVDTLKLFSDGIAKAVSPLQNIVAGTGLTVLQSNIRIQGSGGAVDVSAIPSIVATSHTTDYPEITIIGNSDTNTVTLFDESVLPGSGVILKGSKSITFFNNTISKFIWNPVISKWVEIFRNSVNETKSYSLRTATFGTYYSAGFYDVPSADANLDEGSLTVGYGTGNKAYGAHAFAVAGGAGVTDGSDLVLTVSGTSIDDDGVRTTSDSEVIVADCTTSALNQYYETTKKWIGTITYTLSSTAGSAFNYDFNYGFAKYEDFANKKIQLSAYEMVGVAGANDTSFQVELLHHKSTGWTYASTGFIAGDGAIIDLQTDYNTEFQLGTGLPFAWKRTNLSTVIDGNDSEGIIVRITTGSTNAISSSDIHISGKII